MTKNLKNSVYNHHNPFCFWRALDLKYTLKIKIIKFPTLIFGVESIFEGFKTIGTYKDGQKRPSSRWNAWNRDKIWPKIVPTSAIYFLGGKWPGDVKYGFLKVFRGHNTNKNLILENTRRAPPVNFQWESP